MRAAAANEGFLLKQDAGSRLTASSIVPSENWKSFIGWSAMQLDVYLRETANHAVRLETMLLDAKERLASEGVLSPLETGGALHAIRVLVENAIGKTKRKPPAKSSVN